MKHVVYFAENCFEGIVPFEREDVARAWCAGYSKGASQYGAGMAVALVLPDDEEELRLRLRPNAYDKNLPAEVEKALAAYAAATSPRTSP